MKKLLSLLFFWLTISASWAQTTFTDLQFGRYQIADSQWNVGACTTTSSCQIYSTNPGTMYKIPWTSGQWSWQAGQYLKFVASGNASYPYTGNVYNSNGTLAGTIGSGKVINMGTDANGKSFFFFMGSDNDTGQLFSTNTGMTGSSGYSWTGTLNPTTTQLNTFAAQTGSTAPLSAGQTYTATPTPVPTPIYYTGTAPVKITNVWPTSNNSPANEGATNAFDNNTSTKYLNFDKSNAGVTVKLNSGRVVNGFTITTANDFSGRDPTSYKLYGSNDGVNWVLIQEGSLSLSESRYTVSGMISVNNSNAYVYYYIMFPTTKAGTGCGLDCNSMQIAEITYYYDANNTTTSTATGTNSTPIDPVQASGSVTQTNAPSNQVIQTGAAYTNNSDRTAQNSRVSAWANTPQPYNNAVYVDQIAGDNNTVTISLTGSKNRTELTLDGAGSNTVNVTQTGSNYLKADINGYQNSLTSSQTNTIGTNYAETTIVGNNNIVNHTQSNNNNRLLFSTISGDNNTLSTTQSGAGQHYLDVRMTGNGHNVLVNQYGANANNARIDVTNAGGSATVDLEQAGGKNFTLIQSCTNPLGCSTVVRQQ